MADLSITASAVIPGTGANIRNGTAGAAITAGMAIMKKDSDGLVYPADANDAALDECDGVAVNSAPGIGQPVSWVESGLLTINAVMTAGVAYYVTLNGGGIGARAEVTTGAAVIYIGTALSTTSLNIKIHETGAVSA